MSSPLNKLLNSENSAKVTFLLAFIKENGFEDKLNAELASLQSKEAARPSIYNIEAHSDKVKNLPLELMCQIRESMIDISHPNDDAARFVMLHDDGDKAYHLWVGYEDESMREVGESRFSFSIVGLDDYDTGGDEDFAGHITSDVLKSITDTDCVDEIYLEISKASKLAI